jgi:hypothetical protein
MKQEHMMKKCNEHIEEEISKTLKVLDEMETITAHHLFRARLMHRLEVECGEKQGRGFGVHLDFRLAFMALLLMVNLGSALLSLSNGVQPATTTISELLDSQNDDYASQDFAYYDQTVPSSAKTIGTDNRTP